MKKEIVKKEEGELVFSKMDDAALAVMEKDSETYVDETATDDISIPRIKILQSGSKQIKKADPLYIEGAEEGDFFNTVTEEVTAGDKGLLIVPVKRRVIYIEWRDVDAGGGMIQNFGEDGTEFNKITPNDRGQRRTGDDTEIIKTYETFVYIINPKTGKFSEALMSLINTQVKKQKKFNALIRSLTGQSGKTLPEYAGVYSVKTMPESNDKNSWYNYDINFAGFTLSIPETGKSIYQSAKDFAELVKNNEVKTSYEQEGTSESEEDKM